MKKIDWKNIKNRKQMQKAVFAVSRQMVAYGVDAFDWDIHWDKYQALSKDQQAWYDDAKYAVQKAAVNGAHGSFDAMANVWGDMKL